MKKLFFTLSISLVFLSASAQRIYFVYLQTEQEQPFFVKMNEKVFSSTASGYLILSRLRDSTYSMSVGFPGNKWPEQQFSITINKKDHGYLLKYFEGKGWGLFDLQTLSVRMAAVSNAGNSMPSTENKDVSRFTDILSKAADDPTLKEKPQPVIMDEKKTEVVIQPAIKTEEAKSGVTDLPVPEKKQEEKAVVNDQPVAVKEKEEKTVSDQPVEIKEPEEKPVPAYKPSEVIKLDEKGVQEGLEITYIDKGTEGNKDTVRILIPVPGEPPAAIEKPREEKRFLDITADSNQAKKTNEKPEVIEVKKFKNNCSGWATENDFLKLRKKMAAETNDYDMIDEARKIFKTKCFTVEQVKNLSALFLTDLGKYMFYDAFYLFVSDPENYPELQSQLKDSYYINRFQAMIR